MGNGWVTEATHHAGKIIQDTPQAYLEFVR